MKRILRSNVVAVSLAIIMITSSLAILPMRSTYASPTSMSFSTGETVSFGTNVDMTFWSGVSMLFGTNIQITFIEQIPDGIIQPCDILIIQSSSPQGYIPPPCSWWEVLDPTGHPTGFEFHIDITSPTEIHVDMVFPGPFPVQPGMPIAAQKKVDVIQPCEYFVVHWPVAWYPSVCTWWEIIDPETHLPTGYEFHVDWTNESCEFHVDQVTPGPYILPFPYYEIEARRKISEITPCDWFTVVDPAGFDPTSCSWWEILDPNTGGPTGQEFHVDVAQGGVFHIDQVSPVSPLPIPWGPTYTVHVRQKIDTLQQCGWFKAFDPTVTPQPCTWWKIIQPNIGADVEFHVDISNPDGTFHVDYVDPATVLNPPTFALVAEQKFPGITPCDWFSITNPQGWVPQPCTQWRITSPIEWAGVIFHVDANDGFSSFHIDTIDQLPLGPTPPPWQVTAEQVEPPPDPWYIKPPFPDYATNGMPDFDQKQDAWGPGQGIYTWCGPVSVADSLWWLDSEYESLFNPAPVPPPTISDNFPLVAAYGQWDDHDAQNVDPLVKNLAFLMDTDGLRTGDGHTGTRWQDMATGISMYLAQQGMTGMFEVHSAEFPEFPWIEAEIERCQDVELFLEFWQFTGSTWIRLYDNPSLEFGHFIASAGVNSSTSQLLISDPWQDAFEAGTDLLGRSPAAHLYPHPAQVHNDAQYVSQDAYNCMQWMQPPPSPYGVPVWELAGYLQTMGYDPTWHAFIRAAVATSPLGTHDVAVVNVKTSKDGCLPKPVVSQGKTCRVNVTVENQGTFSETFNVAALASDLLNTYIIGTQAVTLTPGERTTVAFVWDTTGYQRGAYSVGGRADVVIGETDTADNNLSGATLTVTYIADVNDDGVIDIIDIVKVAGVFGSQLGDPAYNPNADLNDDEVIDIIDVVIIAGHFGESAP